MMRKLFFSLVLILLALTMASADSISSDALLGDWIWNGYITVISDSGTTLSFVEYTLTLNARGQGLLSTTENGSTTLPITWHIESDAVYVTGATVDFAFPISFADGEVSLSGPNGKRITRAAETPMANGTATNAVPVRPMTNKPIVFRNYEYGDIYKNIRKNTRAFCIDYLYGYQNSRVIADALYDFAERDHIIQSRVTPSCFFMRTSETFKIGGYDVGTMLWFVFPFQNEDFVLVEDEAVFYAGIYEFHSWDDLVAIHADVKDKLTNLYGDPYYSGSSLNDIMGVMPISSDSLRGYQDDVNKFNPEYTVWKSNANGAFASLAFWYDSNIQEHKLKLAYVSDVAEEPFERMAQSGIFDETHIETTNTDLDGL